MKHESRPEAAIGDLLAGDQDQDTAGDGFDAAAKFRNAYAVLVRGKSVRRHLYLNLPAAERTVRRALDRGVPADLVLVRLMPVVDAAGVVVDDE